jgi:hypothetical protein
MTAVGGCTRLIGFLFVTQRRRGGLPVLPLVLVGLSLSIASAQTPSPSQPGEHVYLLRGAFNVFSLGMDASCSGVASTPLWIIIWPGRPWRTKVAACGP